LPAVAVEAFVGVSNVAVFASLPPGARVLDLGCGAGLDSLIAARRVGPAGRVIGIDFSDSMLTRAGQAAAALGVNVTVCRGDAERLPLETGSIDVALVNGIFNLNPARTEIFREQGFREVTILRATRNARCKDPRVIAAEICARR
jgi:ubiquinone/menaquinone biosynthesis C-methylase UbiE